MSGFDKMAEKYEKKVSFQGMLFEMIEAVLEAGLPLEEQDPAPAGSEKFPIPKLRITEAWGVPESMDREIIEKYSKNIPGSTLGEKLKYLAAVVKGDVQVGDVKDILSTLVMVEVLSTILADFTESAGGFIFEGFLAGLFGDNSVQITDVGDNTGEATGKPITDVVLGDRHYSLKLLGQTTGVKGSFFNMVEHFKAENHIVYLDARRIGKDQGLEFGEFLITKENFLDIFVTPFLKQVYKKEPDTLTDPEDFQNLLKSLTQDARAIKRIEFGQPGIIPSRRLDRVFDFSPTKGEDITLEEAKLSGKGLRELISVIINMDPDLLKDYGPFEIVYAESKFEGTKAEKLFGSFAVVQQLQKAIKSGNEKEIMKSLEMTAGYNNREQFEFTRAQAESIANFEVIAVLPLGRDTLKKAWTNHAELLNRTIAPVYRFLSQFDTNITNYFTGQGGKDERKSHALAATSDIEYLKQATEEAVSTISKKER
jgi:hypothetical protein